MPGYDWADSSGTVDDSKSGYDYSSGTSYGNSNDNSSNNSNNYYSNPDKDYNDSWETSSNPWGNDYEEPYTLPFSNATHAIRALREIPQHHILA